MSPWNYKHVLGSFQDKQIHYCCQLGPVEIHREFIEVAMPPEIRAGTHTLFCPIVNRSAGHL